MLPHVICEMTFMDNITILEAPVFEKGVIERSFD